MEKNSNIQTPVRVSVALVTWVLALCAAIGPMTTRMYLPAFPEIAKSLQVPMVVVQQSLTAYLLGFCAMTPFCGTLSDMFGRKPLLVGGFLGYALASFGVSCSADVTFLLTCRALQGVFGCCGLVVGTAVVRDLFKDLEAQKILAYITIVFAFAPALAPIAGGYIVASAPWQTIFYFMALLGVFLAAVCFFFLPESLPREQRIKASLYVALKDYFSAFSNRRFFVGSLAMGIAFIGQGVYVAGASDWCSNVMGLKPQDFWVLFIPFMLAQAAGAYFSTFLARRITIARTIPFGFGCCLLACLLSFVLMWTEWKDRLPFALIPLMVYSFGFSILRPTLILVLMDFLPKSRGLASSLQTFLQTFLFAMVSALVVPLIYGNASGYLAGLIVCGCLGFAVWQIAVFRVPARACD